MYQLSFVDYLCMLSDQALLLAGSYIEHGILDKANETMTEWVELSEDLNEWQTAIFTGNPF